MVPHLFFDSPIPHFRVTVRFSLFHNFLVYRQIIQPHFFFVNKYNFIGSETVRFRYFRQIMTLLFIEFYYYVVHSAQTPIIS